MPIEEDLVGQERALDGGSRESVAGECRGELLGSIKNPERLHRFGADVDELSERGVEFVEAMTQAVQLHRDLGVCI